MKRTSNPLTQQQKQNLLDLIARVMNIHIDYFTMKGGNAKAVPQSGAALLDEAAASALNCKGVLPAPVHSPDNPTPVDTQGLAAAAAGLDPQGNENAPTIAPNGAGNDKTPPAPKNPVESPSRAPGKKRLTKEDWGHIDIPAKKCKDKAVIEAYAKAIQNEECTLVMSDGGKVIGVKGAGGKGTRWYNNKEFATHAKKIRRWREAAVAGLAFTKTAGAEYGSKETDIDGAQFVCDVANGLKLMAKTNATRWYFCSEFGEGQSLHCHGEILFYTIPSKIRYTGAGTDVDEKTRTYLNKYLHFKDFEKVQWLDPARAEEWFCYCHKYTKYNAAQLFAAKARGDTEAYEAACACIENLMLCQKFHVSQFRASSSKGFKPVGAENDETPAVEAATEEEAPAEKTEYDIAVSALEDALKPEAEQGAVLLAVKNAIKMVFPCACVERYIVNMIYEPKNNTKLSEWRKMALQGSRIKPCDCRFKEIYFHVTDLLQKM